MGSTESKPAYDAAAKVVADQERELKRLAAKKLEDEKAAKEKSDKEDAALRDITTNQCIPAAQNLPPVSREKILKKINEVIDHHDKSRKEKAEMINEVKRKIPDEQDPEELEYLEKYLHSLEEDKKQVDHLYYKFSELRNKLETKFIVDDSGKFVNFLRQFDFEGMDDILNAAVKRV